MNPKTISGMNKYIQIDRNPTQRRFTIRIQPGYYPSIQRGSCPILDTYFIKKQSSLNTFKK